MKIVVPSYDMIGPITLHEKDAIYGFLEDVGRTCYKSHDKVKEGSAKIFVKMLNDRKHHAMIEHVSITVRFISNRGFSHEMVRHRLASFAQESTRYCNYSNDKFDHQITVIKPYWWHDFSEEAQNIWNAHMHSAEYTYFKLLELGLPPQAARGVLPLDIKTEIVVTANLREWKTIFSLRDDEPAHPDMKQLMSHLHQEFKTALPELFG